MGFSRQEYWSGLPFPSPGDLPDPGIEPRSPALETDALPSEPPGEPVVYKHTGCSSCPSEQLLRAVLEVVPFWLSKNLSQTQFTAHFPACPPPPPVPVVAANTIPNWLSQVWDFPPNRFDLAYTGGVPAGSVVKNPRANAGDTSSVPGRGRAPGEGNGDPIQHSSLGNPVDRGAWWATVCGVAAESYTGVGVSLFFCKYAHCKSFKSLTL